MRDVLRDRQQWAGELMVSTGSAPATFAAIDVLTDGGTAFDAAITASAVLTVCLPMACGPGGDAAALLHAGPQAPPVALTSLGRAPAGATTSAYRSRNLSTVPATGILSATTPALIDAWYATHQRYGTLPLDRLLAPAVTLAEQGVVVTAQLSRWIRDNLAVLEQPEYAARYAPYGRPAAIGSRLRDLGLARLYRLIGAPGTTPGQVRAQIGERLAALSRTTGGWFSVTDCAADHAEWAPAVELALDDVRVATTPPPTQGVLLLQNLALYRQVAGGAPVSSPAGVHLLSEIFNQTYGWRLEHLGDPRHVPVGDPLAQGLLDQLSGQVDRQRRSPSRYAGHYSTGDTTHFAILDAAGNAVSWIQSLGLGFGAGLAVTELGLLLCNRLGRSTTLDPRHANCCVPGRRPVNTIFPWSVSDRHGLRSLGGTPGGDGQCQWNAQVLAGLLFDGRKPLEALNLPRWTYLPGSDKIEAGHRPHLQVDQTMAEATREELARAGHDVVTKASVGGTVRVLERHDGFVYGLDDGRQEGLTAGR